MDENLPALLFNIGLREGSGTELCLPGYPISCFVLDVEWGFWCGVVAIGRNKERNDRVLLLQSSLSREDVGK